LPVYLDPKSEKPLIMDGGLTRSSETIQASTLPSRRATIYSARALVWREMMSLWLRHRKPQQTWHPRSLPRRIPGVAAPIGTCDASARSRSRRRMHCSRIRRTRTMETGPRSTSVLPISHRPAPESPRLRPHLCLRKSDLQDP
jgi:hypothetical protein